MNIENETRFDQGADPVQLVRLAPIFDAVRESIRRWELFIPGGVPNAEDMRGIFIRVAREHSITPDDLERWWNLWGKGPAHG